MTNETKASKAQETKKDLMNVWFDNSQDEPKLYKSFATERDAMDQLIKDFGHDGFDREMFFRLLENPQTNYNGYSIKVEKD